MNILAFGPLTIGFALGKIILLLLFAGLVLGLVFVAVAYFVWFVIKPLLVRGLFHKFFIEIEEHVKKHFADRYAKKTNDAPIPTPELSSVHEKVLDAWKNGIGHMNKTERDMVWAFLAAVIFGLAELLVKRYHHHVGLAHKDWTTGKIINPDGSVVGDEIPKDPNAMKAEEKAKKVELKEEFKMARWILDRLFAMFILLAIQFIGAPDAEKWHDGIGLCLILFLALIIRLVTESEEDKEETTAAGVVNKKTSTSKGLNLSSALSTVCVLAFLALCTAGAIYLFRTSTKGSGVAQVDTAVIHTTVQRVVPQTDYNKPDLSPVIIPTELGVWSRDVKVNGQGCQPRLVPKRGGLPRKYDIRVNHGCVIHWEEGCRDFDYRGHVEVIQYGNASEPGIEIWLAPK